MSENRTITNVESYDQNGAIIYTIVILLFYSLSLFCSLILNIDPDDYHYDKNWSMKRANQSQGLIQSNRVDILHTLSDQSFREKYWRIYYGDEEYERRCANEFVNDEQKRLSNVSQRMREFHEQQMKQISSIGEYFHHPSVPNPPSSPDPSISSFLAKFRRTRSTSFPFVSFNRNSIQRSLEILTETPLCKPVLDTHS